MLMRETSDINQILVLPCRNMTEVDKDYAVSFAIPANTKGLIKVPHPMHYRLGDSEFPVELPIRGHTDSLIIFDDIFVPCERVFMCREMFKNTRNWQRS
jgi:aromatic ring hydroxylase